MTTAPSLTLVLAVADNGVIGRAGGLPWVEPEDRAHFEEVTRDHAVIMGRRTFEETGAALSGRRNLVVSSTLGPHRDVQILPSLSAAIAEARKTDPHPRVIGGAAIFAEALPLATRVLLTRIPGHPDGDTYFRESLGDFEIADERVTATGLRFLDYRRKA